MNFVDTITSEIKTLWEDLNGSHTAPNSQAIGTPDQTTGQLDADGNPILKSITPPQNDPYARDYNEIISIQQKGSRGFKIIDIDPYLLPRSSFYPTPDVSTLEAFTGSESGTVQGGFTNESDILPWWRTVQIDALANWIKIEYLPSIINDNLGYLHKNYPDETINPNGNVLGNNASVKYTSERILLIQFDDTSMNPIIAKHGDVFKLPFNTAFLTMKVWSPKIRVTIGYNAEIESQNDQDFSPAFGAGHGLRNNQTLHCVPFCITADDIAGPFGAITTSFALSTVSQMLIANPFDATYNSNGLLCGWFSSFEAFSNAPTSFATIGWIDLFVGTYPNMNIIRRLASINMNIANGYGSNFQSYQELIRFTLHANECLFIRVRNQLSSGQTLNTRFSLTGYTYGNIQGASNLTPFLPQYKLTQEPYPQDRDSLGAPGV